MSTLGGGELLRSVITANALSSSPFFYCAELTGSDGSGAAVTTKTAVLQLKSQSYFLMTSLFGLSSNSSVSQPEFINIYDASNQKALINGAAVFSGPAGAQFANPNSAYAGLFNDTLANCVTLPEYVLWKPNSLVGITWMGRNALDLFQHYRYLVLAGIEYEMEGH